MVVNDTLVSDAAGTAIIYPGYSAYAYAYVRTSLNASAVLSGVLVSRLSDAVALYYPFTVTVRVFDPPPPIEPARPAPPPGEALFAPGLGGVGGDESGGGGKG